METGANARRWSEPDTVGVMVKTQEGRRRSLKIVLSCLAAAAAASCSTPSAQTASTTQTASTGQKQCFHNSDVRTFSDAGPNKVLVSIGRRDVWELTVAPGCPRIDFTSRLAIVARGSSYICTGSDVDLVVPSASGRGSQRCRVREERKYTPEEAAAVRS